MNSQELRSSYKEVSDNYDTKSFKSGITAAILASGMVFMAIGMFLGLCVRKEQVKAVIYQKNIELYDAQQTPKPTNQPKSKWRGVENPNNQI